jgi:hypothetical protein
MGQGMAVRMARGIRMRNNRRRGMAMEETVVAVLLAMAALPQQFPIGSGETEEPA